MNLLYIHSSLILLSVYSITKGDHFADVSKMVDSGLPCIVTGFLCFVNYVAEIAPLCVT